VFPSPVVSSRGSLACRLLLHRAPLLPARPFARRPDLQRRSPSRLSARGLLPPPSRFPFPSACCELVGDAPVPAPALLLHSHRVRLCLPLSLFLESATSPVRLSPMADDSLNSPARELSMVRPCSFLSAARSVSSRGTPYASAPLIHGRLFLLAADRRAELHPCSSPCVARPRPDFLSDFPPQSSLLVARRSAFRFLVALAQLCCRA
jgi:hypothetical protein